MGWGVSDPINITQGVWQGGILSTGHYKRYNNPLLLQLEQRYTRIKVGLIFTCILPVVDTIVSLRLLQVHFDVFPHLCLDLCYQPGSILLQIYLGAHTNVY